MKLFCILDWNTTNHVLYPEQKQLVAFTTLIDLSLYCYKLYTCEWKCVSLTGIPKTPRTFVNFYLLSYTVKKLCSSAYIKSRVSHSCITPSVSCHLSYSMLCGKVGGAKLHRCSSLHFFAETLCWESPGESDQLNHDFTVMNDSVYHNLQIWVYEYYVLRNLLQNTRFFPISLTEFMKNTTVREV